MDETRESCLAELLVRGLIRVRRRAERTGTWKLQGENQPQPTAVELSPGANHSVDQLASANQRGDQQ
jgi:hypothetical protein